MQACDRCHARKTRCDRRTPSCGACTKASVPCVQTDKVNQRALPRAYIESLEANLRRAEREKQALRDQLAAIRGSNDIQIDPATPSAGPPLSPPTTESQRQWAPAVGTLLNTPVAQTAATPQNLACDTAASEIGVGTLEALIENRNLGSNNEVTSARVVHSLLRAARLPLGSTKANTFAPYEQAALSASKNSLPSTQAAATRAVQAYLDHWNLIFPIIHPPRLWAILNRTYAEDDYYENHPYEAFVLGMVAAMGTAGLNRLEWSEVSPEVHYIRAMSKLEEVQEMKGLAPLRAVLLLCQYGIFCSMRDTSASMWQIVGIAARLCIDLGLHREPPAKDTTLQSPDMKLELELRKRCFWCVYNLDRIVSITLCRPVIMRDDEIDVSLPSSFGPDDLALHQVEQPDHIPPFLHLIAIRKLAGKISQAVHSTVSNRYLSHQQKSALRNKLHQELNAWKAAIPNVNLNPSKPTEQIPSSFRWASWYEVPYHNAILLLYRPSPVFPSNTGGHAEEWRAALDQIYTSSKAVIHLYADLHRTKRLNHSWITLHAVFMAGLAYVYCISQIMKETLRANQDPPACLDYACILNDTRVCTNVLVAINERWGAARESCEIFERLSTALIQDAVKAHLKLATKRKTLAGPSRSSQSVRSPENLSGLNNKTLAQNSPDSNLAAFMDTGTSQNTQTSSHSESPQLLSATEFRQFYQELQSAQPGVFQFDHDVVPSELLSGFSQDWFEGDAMAGISSSNHMMD